MDAIAVTTSVNCPERKRLKLFYNQIHERNIGLVKLLLNTVLPVKYSDDFYKRVIASPFAFSKMGTEYLATVSTDVRQCYISDSMNPRSCSVL
jgi:hypothetical protein